MLSGGSNLFEKNLLALAFFYYGEGRGICRTILWGIWIASDQYQQIVTA